MPADASRCLNCCYYIVIMSHRLDHTNCSFSSGVLGPQGWTEQKTLVILNP